MQCWSEINIGIDKGGMFKRLLVSHKQMDMCISK